MSKQKQSNQIHIVLGLGGSGISAAKLLKTEGKNVLVLENNSNKKLGYMYFIICLSFVCHECWSIHQDWLVYAITNV